MPFGILYRAVLAVSIFYMNLLGLVNCFQVGACHTALQTP